MSLEEAKKILIEALLEEIEKGNIDKTEGQQTIEYINTLKS